MLWESCLFTEINLNNHVVYIWITSIIWCENVNNASRPLNSLSISYGLNCLINKSVILDQSKNSEFTFAAFPADPFQHLIGPGDKKKVMILLK